MVINRNFVVLLWTSASFLLSGIDYSRVAVMLPKVKGNANPTITIISREGFIQDKDDKDDMKLSNCVKGNDFTSYLYSFVMKVFHRS